MNNEEAVREFELRKQMEQKLIDEQMRLILQGGSPTFRVIAKFGPSVYDITITKPEEMELVQSLLNRFKDSFSHNNFF